MKHLLSFFLFVALLFPNVTKAAYDPTVGVWLSRDPIGEQGGLNLYQYVLNNPINLIDPLGLTNLNLQSQTADRAGPVFNNINPSQYYSVNGHGINDNSIEDDRNLNAMHGGPLLSPEDLAKIIKNDTDHFHNQPVILYSCSLGANGKKSFAQRLADALGVPVVAPDNTLWVDHRDNSLSIYPPIPGSKPPQPDTSKSPGQWVTFPSK